MFYCPNSQHYENNISGIQSGGNASVTIVTSEMHSMGQESASMKIQITKIMMNIYL